MQLRHQPEHRQTQDVLQGALSASDQDVLKTSRQTLCYGACLAVVVALLAALLAFFILHSQSGIRPRALCVSAECKRFALEVMTAAVAIGQYPRRQGNVITRVSKRGRRSSLRLDKTTYM